jgi:hypothetical protein
VALAIIAAVAQIGAKRGAVVDGRITGFFVTQGKWGTQLVTIAADGSRTGILINLPMRSGCHIGSTIRLYRLPHWWGPQYFPQTGFCVKP